MGKILLGILALLILSFIIIAMYCALIIDDFSDKENKSKENDELFKKKQLCSKCKIGQESYELDRHSAVCPYISCWRKGKCQFYEPIEKPLKGSIHGSATETPEIKVENE